MTDSVFDFWVGVLAVDVTLDAAISNSSDDGDSALPSLLNVGRPLHPGGRFIVEVVRERTQAGLTHLLLLLSTTDGHRVVGRPWHGCFGFTDNVDLGDELCARGFTLLEAVIHLDPARDGQPACLRVLDPLATGAADDPLGAALLTLRGLQLDPPAGEASKVGALTTDYTQSLLAPEIGASSAEVLVRESVLGLRRASIQRLRVAGANLQIQPSVRLNLAPLAGPTRPIALAWRGTLPEGLWMEPTAPPAAAAGTQAPASPRPARPSRRSRPAALAATGFRFEDVELYGFRIDLREHGEDADRALEQMVTALNSFHTRVTDPKTGLPGKEERLDTAFRYRAASRTVVIELLRYGKMLLGETPWPGASEPFTAQHELLLRVLVGRVDDNTTQARDPAVFVPAIFVDNPLSKLIGRELQGFKKQLASFVDGANQPLSIDGFCGADPVRRPLADVTKVLLTDRPGDPGDNRSPILEITWPARAAQADESESFETLPSEQYATRWRQDDFDDVEFRRAFAGNVLAEGWNHFRSLQVGPVDTRQMPKAWIGGRCTLRDVRASFPVGIVTLTLGNNKNLTPAWQQLHEQFGRDREVALPSGAWYHIRCSLDLRLE